MIPNTELVQIAMSYARSRMLCAAARLGWPETRYRSPDDLAKAPPLSPNRNASTATPTGCDWGRSFDYTVFVVVDVTAKAMVMLDRSNQVDYHVQRGRLQAVYERWKPQTIIAEANSIGMPIIEELTRSGLPVTPFTTTNASKAHIIEALALAFEQRSIAILPDAVLLAELQAFAAEQLPGGLMRYGAPGGQHDDTVIALALAWSAVQNAGGFGLTEYLLRGQAELDAGRDPFKNISTVPRGTGNVQDVHIQAAGCACGHRGLLQKPATGAFRCAQCGAQTWGHDKHPPPRAASLEEIYSSAKGGKGKASFCPALESAPRSAC